MVEELLRKPRAKVGANATQSSASSSASIARPMRSKHALLVGTTLTLTTPWGQPHANKQPYQLLTVATRSRCTGTKAAADLTCSVWGRGQQDVTVPPRKERGGLEEKKGVNTCKKQYACCLRPPSIASCKRKLHSIVSDTLRRSLTTVHIRRLRATSAPSSKTLQDKATKTLMYANPYKDGDVSRRFKYRNAKYFTITLSGNTRHDNASLTASTTRIRRVLVPNATKVQMKSSCNACANCLKSRL